MTTYRYTGSAHPFYQYGESYTLHIFRMGAFHILAPLRIEVWRGKESVINKSVTRYKDWEAFEKDWVAK